MSDDGAPPEPGEYATGPWTFPGAKVRILARLYGRGVEAEVTRLAAVAGSERVLEKARLACLAGPASMRADVREAAARFAVGSEVDGLGEKHAAFEAAWDAYLTDRMKAASAATAGPWDGKAGWETEPPLEIVTETKRVGRGDDPTTTQVPVEAGYEVYNSFVGERAFRAFRTVTGEPRVAIPTPHGVEVRNPRDETFAEWCGYRFYTLKGERVPTREIGVATLALIGRALAPELPPERVLELAIRFAKTGPDETLLDLADAERRCVRLTPDGWSVQTVGMPVFDRPAHMAPLPVPNVGGGLPAALRLFDFILVGLPDSSVGSATERTARLNGQRLLVLVSQVTRVLRPRSPKPAPIVLGDEGAGKSSSADRYASALDPSVVAHLGVPKDDGELLALALNRATLSFDNVSRIEPWLSDGLARLTTGTGIAKRRLYTDRDEVVSRLCPQVLLNGITASPRFADLIRRSLFIWIERPPKPKGEDDLAREWKEAHPAILGGLLDLASATARELRDAPPSDGAGDESMADFVRVGRALERAIGGALGSFDEAWAENRTRQTAAASESPWVAALFETFNRARSAGELNLTAEEIARRVSDGFPESFPEKVSAQQAGNEIARCRRTLIGLGITVERRRGHAGARLYHIVEAPAPHDSTPPLEDFSRPGDTSKGDTPLPGASFGVTLNPLTAGAPTGDTPAPLAGISSPAPSSRDRSVLSESLGKGVSGVTQANPPIEKSGDTSGDTTEAPRLEVSPKGAVGDGFALGLQEELEATGDRDRRARKGRTEVHGEEFP